MTKDKERKLLDQWIKGQGRRIFYCHQSYREAAMVASGHLGFRVPEERMARRMKKVITMDWLGFNAPRSRRALFTEREWDAMMVWLKLHEEEVHVSKTDREVAGRMRVSGLRFATRHGAKEAMKALRMEPGWLGRRMRTG